MVQRAVVLRDRLVAVWGQKCANELELARMLSELEHERLYLALGYCSLHEYTSTNLNISGRTAGELIRIARMLPDLPSMERALVGGRIQWTKARELLRVVTPQTEAAWVARAQECSNRELERLVSAAMPGDGPSDAPCKREAVTTVVFTRVEASDAELIRTVIAQLRAEHAGEEVTDAALLASFLRSKMEAAAPDAPSDAPTSEPYVVHLTRCVHCQHVGGYHAHTSETVAEECGCDARVVAEDGRSRRTIPSSVRERVLHRDQRSCVVPGCRSPLWLHLHHLRHWAKGGDHSASNLVCLCAAHHRQVHAGVLAVEVDPRGCVVVTTGDGRVRVGPPHPERKRPVPHVGDGRQAQPEHAWG